jgi:hypothetical protein
MLSLAWTSTTPNWPLSAVWAGTIETFDITWPFSRTSIEPGPSAVSVGSEST